MCPYHIQVCFYPEKIYFFSIQVILNEFSTSHFLASEIFVKISSLESLATYHPENRKNILTVSEFDETFMGHWISRDESNGAIRFFIRYIENFLSFPESLWQFIIIIIIIFSFLKISNFSEFYMLCLGGPKCPPPLSSSSTRRSCLRLGRPSLHLGVVAIFHVKIFTSA